MMWIKIAIKEEPVGKILSGYRHRGNDTCQCGTKIENILVC